MINGFGCFLKYTAIKAHFNTTYDYHKYLRDLTAEVKDLVIPEKPPIVGADGNLLSVVK